MRLTTPQSRRDRIIAGLILAALSWAVLLILYFGNFLESYELRTYDQLCRFDARDAGKPRDTVLVAVDQGSLEAAGGQGINWPWPRQMYAPIVEFCLAAGARAVVFDVLFTESSSYGVEDDLLLAEALRKGRTFLPVFLSREERPQPTDEKLIIDRLALSMEDRLAQTRTPYKSIILPVDVLARSTYGFGNVEIPPDADGIYRRMPLVFLYRDKWMPALGLSAFAYGGEKLPTVLEENRLSVAGISIPLLSDGNFLLRYYGDGREFPRFSAFNVIQSHLALQEGGEPSYPPELFRDKIVFVGFTAPGLYDLKPTPTSSIYPGAAIHATLVENLLRKDFRTRISTISLLALTAAAATAAALTVMLVASFWKLGLLIAAYAVGLVLLDVTAFGKNLWIDVVLPLTGLLLSFATATTFSYATEGRQRRQIKQMFSHYMSDLLLEDLLKNPDKLRLGGEKRVLTVFFSDLAGFTSLSEKLKPEEVVSLLNRYLTEMTDIIMESGGLIDKYEGDAIMAFWGAPIPQEDHAARACYAALDNQHRLAELRKEFAAAGLPPVYSRIGINTGEMIIGNMGSSKRFDFTVIGDNVNLASRLEGAGKEYGTGIIISEATFSQAADRVEVRELDFLQVKGKEIPVRIYELLSRKGALEDKMKEVRDHFETGLAHYRRREWESALEAFRRALAASPDDGPSRTYIRRCEEFLENPPPDDWNGVYRLITK